MAFLDFLPFIGNVVEGIFGKSSQEDAQDHAKEFAQNKHQWEQQDLQAAGLNPMLGLLKGTSSAGPSGAMAPTPQFGQSVVSAAQAAKAREEANLVRAQTQTATTQADKNQADANLAKAQTIVAQEQIPHVRAQVDYSISGAKHLNQQVLTLQSQAKHYDSLVTQIPASISQLNALTDEVRARIPTHAASIGLIRSQVSKIAAEIPNLKLTGQQIQHLTEKIKVDGQLAALDYTIGVTKDWPEAQAAGKKARSAYGQNVSPYLSDVGKVTGSAADAARTVQGLRSPRYWFDQPDLPTYRKR